MVAQRGEVRARGALAPGDQLHHRGVRPEEAQRPGLAGVGRCGAARAPSGPPSRRRLALRRARRRRRAGRAPRPRAGARLGDEQPPAGGSRPSGRGHRRDVAPRHPRAVARGRRRPARSGWRTAFGYADVENEVAARPETVYRLASVSKPMTAVAVLQLAAERPPRSRRPGLAVLPRVPAEALGRDAAPPALAPGRRPRLPARRASADAPLQGRRRRPRSLRAATRSPTSRGRPSATAPTATACSAAPPRAPRAGRSAASCASRCSSRRG